jgi:hypothetical protein
MIQYLPLKIILSHESFMNKFFDERLTTEDPWYIKSTWSYNKETKEGFKYKFLWFKANFTFC